MGPVGELLSDPARWAQNGLAVDKDGKPVSPTSGEAAAFCLLGALDRSYPDADTWLGAADKLLSAIHKRCSGVRSIVHFNDDRDTGYEDIMAVVREAGI